MKGFVRALAVVGLFVGCGGDGGCRIEQEPIIVLHSVALDEMCIFSPSGTPIPGGLYDVSGGTGYVLGPILRNNLVARSTEGSNTGIEDGELRLEPDVDITVHLPDEVADRLPADVSTSFVVSVATDSLPPESEIAFAVELLSPELIEALPGAVGPGDYVEARVDVVFHATRTGNSRRDIQIIDAREYTFPLDLCHGCLITRCECDAVGECVPGTGQHATSCGRTQDPNEDFMFACADEAASSDASTGSQAGAGSSSGP